MTFTPFILFIILLFILVISSVFGKRILSVEGFQEGATTMTQITKKLQSMSLPQYSTKHNVYQLYDSLFFDDQNANLIEVSTTLTIPNPQAVGNSISQSATIVTPRDGNETVTYISQYASTIIPQDVNSSLVTSISPQFTSWSYNTQTIPPANSYSLFYMPWGNNTFVHVIDNASNNQLGTFFFSPGDAPQSIYYPPGNVVGLTSFVMDNDIANNSMVTEPLYNTTRQVYQISHYVKYDITNGNLLVQNGQGPLTTFAVYDINKNANLINATNQTAISNYSSTVPNVSFKPYTIVDTLGQNLILYIPHEQHVLIALISYADAGLNEYVLSNVCRFNANGIDKGDQIGDMYSAGQYYQLGPGLGPSPQQSSMNNSISEYYKWYWYWNSVGTPGQGNHGPHMGSIPGHGNHGPPNMPPPLPTTQNIPANVNDYILKTQIVPPVCPTCPNCPSSGICTTCGGKGGSGTMTKNGSIVNGPQVGDVMVDQNGKVITDSKGNIQYWTAANIGQAKVQQQGSGWVSKIGSGTFESNANPDTVGGSLTLATYDTVAGVEDVAKTGAGVVTGVAGAAGSTITGVAGAAGGAISGVAGAIGGVANNAISTTGRILESHPGTGSEYGNDKPNQRSTTYTTGGTNNKNSANDPYSYYGQLPARGKANFMPLTADFSRFGK
jgi:hypothetical protein